MRTISVELADTSFGAPWYARRMHLVPAPAPGRRSGGRYRRLDYFEILTVESGEGRLVFFDGGFPRETRLIPGDVLLFRPTDDPLMEATGPDGMTIVFVAFAVTDWRIFETFVAIDPGWREHPDPPRAHLDPRDPETFRPFAVVLARSGVARVPIDLLEFWLVVVPRLLPTRDPDPGSVGVPEWLASALDDMRAEENLRAGLARLRQLTRVSDQYLSIATRRHFGGTPTALVNGLRLRHAAHLLSATSEDVGRIARRCGFSRLSYFSRCFQREYRLSPREYRIRALSGFAPPSAYPALHALLR